MSRLADPVKMMKQGAPRVIRSEAELEEYTEKLFKLTAKRRPTRDEREAIDLLSLLIERYESERYKLPEISPLDVLRYLMESHGLKQRDLTEELGSVTNVSLILSGQRNLTLKHMRVLASRFKIPVSAFLPPLNRRAA
jgi:HTH-type transcriptional regulator/antitoxin HigA